MGIALLLLDCILRNRKNKRAGSGWNTIDGICCIHNGESRADTRSRAALKEEGGAFIYTCRNCSFKTGWTPGQNLSNRMKLLLGWAGTSQEEIKHLNFKIWQIKETGKLDLPIRERNVLEFSETTLPEGAKPIQHWLEQPTQDDNFMKVMNYLCDRGEDILTGYDYYWTPTHTWKDSLNKRIIIPFRWQEKIVGWTARAIFPTRNRYYSEVPQNYFFNTEVSNNDWEYLFINEGPFDAISNNGVAMLGDKISEEQIRWLNQTGKTLIVVPDRQNGGGALVDIALKEGWYVSFPKWDSEIKDSADASRKYGKLYTIWSIIDAKTNNRLQINIERQRYK